MKLKGRNDKENTRANLLLSLSRNLTRNEEKQNLAQAQSSKILRQILLIYITDDNRLFIDRTAAYALGLTKVRAIMLDKGPSLFEINKNQLEMLKIRDFDIEYKKISTDEVPLKPVIKVFIDGIDYYIETSAAYALELITEKNFFAIENPYYRISDNMLAFLKSKYSVVIQDIRIEDKKRR